MLKPRFKLLHAGLALIGGTLLAEVIFLLVLTTQLVKVESALWSEARASSTASAANEVLKSFYLAGTTLMGYGFTRSKDMERAYEAAVAKMRDDSERAWIGLQIDPSATDELIQEAQKMSSDAMETLSEVRRVLDESPNLTPDDLSVIGGRFQGVLHEYFQVISRIVERERVKRQESLKQEGTSRDIIKFVIIGGFGLNAAISLATLLFWIRGVTNRIAVLVEDAHRLGRGQELLPLRGGADELGHLETVFHDVRKQLAEAEQLKKEFSALISHELRSPLTSISGTLVLLQEGCLGDLDERGRERVKRASHSSKRLLNLINELLDIHKMEAGKFQLKYAETDMQEVLEVAASELGTLAANKSIQVEIDAQSQVVVMDADRIGQVVINFLSNALKFSSPKTTVTLAAAVRDGMMEVRVNDQGPGVPPEFEGKLFGKYEQAAGGTGSSGLGLFICKGIIASHGGTIGAENLPTGGASFWFRLPLGSSG